MIFSSVHATHSRNKIRLLFFYEKEKKEMKKVNSQKRSYVKANAYAFHGKKTGKQLAEELGVSTSTIATIVAGFTPHSAAIEARLEAVEQNSTSFGGEKTAKELASELGVSHHTIRHDIRVVRDRLASPKASEILAAWELLGNASEFVLEEAAKKAEGYELEVLHKIEDVDLSVAASRDACKCIRESAKKRRNVASALEVLKKHSEAVQK